MWESEIRRETVLEGEKTWLRATEKQTLTESFSHSTLAQIIQWDKTRGLHSGWKTFKSPLTLCHFYKVTSDNGATCKQRDSSKTRKYVWEVHYSDVEIIHISWIPKQRSECLSEPTDEQCLGWLSENWTHLLLIWSVYSVDRTHKWCNRLVWCNQECVS